LPVGVWYARRHIVVGHMWTMISIFAGAQLFALGILGEYLARMHFRLMDKPSYVVLSRSDDPKE